LGFWFWFAIFAAITLVALAWYSLLGLKLARKAKDLQPAGERFQGIAAKLSAAGNIEPVLEPIIAALDQKPEQVLARRSAVLKANKQRKEIRQRRLIERLRNLKIDESRFR